MTAMQQLLNQMREERSKLPLPAEWDRCYQAIEMMIENTYLQMEKQQMEISDEEIMEAAYKYAEIYQCPTDIKMCKHDVISAWNKAIKWYREQLKQSK